MSIKFDHKDFDKFLKNFENLEKDYDLFCRQFLLKEAMKVLADTKALTPVKTGDLRNRWELTQVFKTAKGYYIQIFNSQGPRIQICSSPFSQSFWWNRRNT